MLSAVCSPVFSDSYQEVYYAPSLSDPATAEGGSWVPEYSTGNSNNVVLLGPIDRSGWTWGTRAKRCSEKIRSTAMLLSGTLCQ